MMTDDDPAFTDAAAAAADNPTSHLDGNADNNPTPDGQFTREFYGSVYFQAPDRASSHEDLTKAELVKLVTRGAFNNLPVLVEHGRKNPDPVGRVTRVELKGDGTLFAWWRYHNNDRGRRLEADQRRGVLNGLSLSHNWKTKEMVELSVCQQGRRPQTWIVNASELGSEDDAPSKVDSAAYVIPTASAATNGIASMSTTDLAQNSATSAPAAAAAAAPPAGAAAAMAQSSQPLAAQTPIQSQMQAPMTTSAAVAAAGHGASAARVPMTVDSVMRSIDQAAGDALRQQQSQSQHAHHPRPNTNTAAGTKHQMEDVPTGAVPPMAKRARTDNTAAAAAAAAIDSDTLERVLDPPETVPDEYVQTVTTALRQQLGTMKALKQAAEAEKRAKEELKKNYDKLRNHLTETTLEAADRVMPVDPNAASQRQAQLNGLRSHFASMDTDALVSMSTLTTGMANSAAAAASGRSGRRHNGRMAALLSDMISVGGGSGSSSSAMTPPGGAALPAAAAASAPSSSSTTVSLMSAFAGHSPSGSTTSTSPTATLAASTSTMAPSSASSSSANRGSLAGYCAMTTAPGNWGTAHRYIAFNSYGSHAALVQASGLPAGATPREILADPDRRAAYLDMLASKMNPTCNVYPDTQRGGLMWRRKVVV